MNEYNRKRWEAHNIKLQQLQDAASQRTNPHITIITHHIDQIAMQRREDTAALELIIDLREQLNKLSVLLKI